MRHKETAEQQQDSYRWLQDLSQVRSQNTVQFRFLEPGLDHFDPQDNSKQTSIPLPLKNTVILTPSFQTTWFVFYNFWIPM